MDISVHFSRTEAPEYVRTYLVDWLEEHLTDLEPEHNLKVQLYCSKECDTPKGHDPQFKCRMLASAPWIRSPIVIHTAGDNCWETISDGCVMLRQQVAKSRKKIRSHRHDPLPEIRSETFNDSFEDDEATD